MKGKCNIVFIWLLLPCLGSTKPAKKLELARFGAHEKAMAQPPKVKTIASLIMLLNGAF